MAALPSLAALRPEGVYEFASEVFKSESLDGWKQNYEKMIQLIQKTVSKMFTKMAQVKLGKVRIALIGYNATTNKYILSVGGRQTKHENTDSLRNALQTLLEEDDRVKNVYDVYFVV